MAWIKFLSQNIIFLILFWFSVISTLIEAQAFELGGGKFESCPNEGEEVRIDSMAMSECFKCICQNGLIKCEQKTCPPIDDCYVLERKKPNTCCEKCKECIHNGNKYASGSEWTDSDDPCINLKCVAGVITESKTQCYTQCSNPLPPRPGQCCPTCFGCHLNGQKVHDGREVHLEEDPCLKCQCSDKKLTCMKKACPVLQCPITKQIKSPNECCPRCKERKEIMQLLGKCIFGKNLHSDGQHFKPDPCSVCTCENGTSVCTRNTCPVLECAIEYQKTDIGACCPHCPLTQEVRTSCSFKDVEYQNNETWNLGPCRSCRCYNGEIRCALTTCPKIKCKPNESLITAEDQCCPKCVESAGTCTVFGDPHYKTFDGKFFSFQGSCKYQLTADCRDHSFSIRITNDARGTLLSSWTKTVTLKLKGIRVNLGQKLRIKVNGTRVQLPYNYEDIIQIEKISEGVLVKTDQGLQIEWDGNNFLQVQAPSTYKNRLCGLCGNYNGLVRDDLTSRDGSMHSDQEVYRFANSWKVGGIKACSRRRENIAKQPTCKGRKKLQFCSALRDNISGTFGDCESRLNPHNYYESCVMDMCECPFGTSCYCDSFTAYANECKRLGSKLPSNWRNSSNCPIIKPMRSQYYKKLNVTMLTQRRIPEVFQNSKSMQQQPKQKQQHRKRTTRRPESLIPEILLMKPNGRTPPPLH